MTKNLNWEISTKNLVIFKRWDGVNDKIFLIFWSSLKHPFFFFGCEEGVERVHEQKIIWEGGVNRLKRGLW